MRLPSVAVVIAAALTEAAAFAPPVPPAATTAVSPVAAAPLRAVAGDDGDERVAPSSPPPPFAAAGSAVRSAAFAAALSASVLGGIGGAGGGGGLLRPPPAHAADYGSITNEQKLVAEAWRLLDGSYLDRTFNGQDWFKVRQDAVKKKYKTVEEARSAVDTMASGLGDKYTRYLTPNKYRSIVDSATGSLAGVGVEISFDAKGEGGRILASDVEPGSPAQGGGIRKGDIFLEVDGTRMDGGDSTPDDVAAKLRGPVGSKVGVVMERDGKTLDYILTREPIKITSVRPYMSDASVAGGKVGVVRIKSFSGTTAETVAGALSDLKAKGAKSFVIDVRNNPGGLLPGGVDTASLFLDADVPVVYVVNKNRSVDVSRTLNAGQEAPSGGTPLVILANGNTASAAEVMTAALKENGRAIVVGDKGAERTFGKGVVQTIRGLAEGEEGGLAITVSRYETPNRNDINKLGIVVDFVADPKCESEDAAVCIPKEAFKAPQA